MAVSHGTRHRLGFEGVPPALCNFATANLRSEGFAHMAFAANKLSDTLIEQAGVAELADAPDSKSGARKGVEVQVLSPVLVSR